MPAMEINIVHLECEGTTVIAWGKPKVWKVSNRKIADGENKLFRAQNKKCTF